MKLSLTGQLSFSPMEKLGNLETQNVQREIFINNQRDKFAMADKIKCSTGANTTGALDTGEMFLL